MWIIPFHPKLCIFFYYTFGQKFFQQSTGAKTENMFDLTID